MRMLSLYHHELTGKAEEYEAQKYLMVDGNILDFYFGLYFED